MNVLEPAAYAALTVTAVQFFAGIGSLVVTGTAPPPIEGRGYVTGTVSAGEVVPVNWTITKRTNCDGTNSRVWSGQNGFHLTEEARPTQLPQTETAQHYTIETKVPEQAPPGSLTLTIQGEYTCPTAPSQAFVLGPVNMEVTE